METELPPDPGPAPESTPETVPATPVPVFVTPPATIVAVAAPAQEEALPLPDRGTGLVIFGVVQILLGLLAALMVPFVALSAVMSHFTPGGSMRIGQFFSAVATYGFIAAALLTLGIGSVRMKRWARALTLVTSWYWLIMGTLVTILLTAVLPLAMKSVLAQMQRNTPDAPSPQAATGVMAVILTLIIMAAAFFLVILPIAFVVFYGRKDVGETCRRRDPVERWTDRVPLPVLGASVVLLTGALYLFLTGITTPLFPFFGRYLTGIPAGACFIAMAALDTYLSIALFRLQSSAWWLATCTLAIRLLSMIITYARSDMMQAYSKMGMSDAQLQVMNSSPILRSHVLLWWSLISIILFFGYLLWLKRYFNAPSKPGAGDLPAPVA